MKSIDDTVALDKALWKFTEVKWNCSESVLYGLLSQFSENNTDLEKYVTLVSGFNGGVGGSRHLCGAISGAVASLGLIFGKFGIVKQDNAFCSKLSKELLQHFKNNFNTVECYELTKEFTDFHAPERREHCRIMITYAIKECAAIINRNV